MTLDAANRCQYSNGVTTMYYWDGNNGGNLFHGNTHHLVIGVRRGGGPTPAPLVWSTLLLFAYITLNIFRDGTSSRQTILCTWITDWYERPCFYELFNKLKHTTEILMVCPCFSEGNHSRGLLWDVIFHGLVDPYQSFDLMHRRCRHHVPSKRR
jgi:hypothetical protein